MKIVVTGASKGIGLEILKGFAKHKIIEISRTPVHGENIEWIGADLTDYQDIKKVCNYIKNEEIDILINNAGAGEVCDLYEVSKELLDREFMLNLYAPVFLTQAVLKGMCERNFGRIINMASISGNKGTPYLFVYSAAKAALMNFSESCAQYIKNKNVTINSISPGGIDTEMSVEGRKKISKMHQMKEVDYQNEMLLGMGRKELLSPIEVVKIIKLLISSEGINGQNIKVSGLL